MDIADFVLNSNTAILYAIALFYAVIGGANINFRARVVLIYSFACVVVLFGSVDFASVLLGSVFVLFLLFEVFSSDEKLVGTFGVGYKVLDFCYRVIVEHYGWLYCGILVVLYWSPIMQISMSLHYLIGIALMTLLAVFVSRARFSSKPVSDIFNVLLKMPAADSVWYIKNRQKADILLAFEDRDFFREKNFSTRLLFGEFLGD